MAAYYNEIDPYAAQWLRNLIKAGHIAPGDVDERSIELVAMAELSAYTQCHFFAGVGIWSLALRQAGWPDDRPVWTGSCPCQPFSSAGAGAGFDDPRHLWPHFARLIRECRPPVVLGEQVAGKIVEPWIDLVQADLEAVDYAFGCVPFPSAGVGAPHIRDRLYWVAHTNYLRQSLRHGQEGASRRRQGQGAEAVRYGVSGELADADRDGRQSGGKGLAAVGHRPTVEPSGRTGGVADAEGRRRGEERQNGGGGLVGDRSQGRSAGSEHGGGDLRSGPVNGLWRAADWLLCRDGKWRPVEPGTFPLADGLTARVGRLRAYGNALNVEAARVFIEAYTEII